MSPPDPLTSLRADDAVGGTVLGRFRIVRRLAIGGMGSVYLARTEGADGFVRPVVVKRILPHLVGDDEIRNMFSREARILARLRHPGIVGIQEFALEGDAYVMVLDYVHGYTFAKWIRHHRDTHGPVPAELAVHVVVRVLDALEYAHRLTDAAGEPLGIVHRDVTPSNVLLDVNGDVKLADFGIARSTAEATQASDQGASIKGKFAYLAPEIFDGAPASAATDTYSCAVVLHQALTGRNEFRAQEPRQVVARVLQHVPTRVDALRDDVSPALADALAAALDKRADRAFRTAGAFAAALRETGLAPMDTLAARLATLLERDFRDPRMARGLGLEPLDALEAAWTGPLPAAGPSDPESLSSGPTAPARRPPASPDGTPRAQQPAAADPPGQPAAAAGRGVPWGLVAAGAALLAALISGGVWLAARPAAAPPPVLVVSAPDRAPAGAPAGDEAPPPPGPAADQAHLAEPPPGAAGGAGAPVGGSPGAPDRVEGARGPAGRASGPTPEQRITRAFGRQQRALERCTNDHAEAIAGAPRLAVRLDVGPDGRVRRAEVLPPEVGRTPLGACLARASEGARFDPEDGDVTVRIPLRLSRVPGR